MTKAELVASISNRLGTDKNDTQRVVVSLATIVTDALKANDEVTL